MLKVQQLTLRLGSLVFAGAVLGVGMPAFAQAPAPSAAEITATANAIGEYKRSVANKVSAATKQKASRAGYQTIAVVGYTIEKSGNVTQTWIVRSSGNPKIDNAALDTFKKALPLPAPALAVFGTDQEASLSEAFVFATDGTWKLQSLIK